MQDENKLLMEYFGSIIESCDMMSDGHCLHVRLCSELLFDKLIQFFPEYGLTKKDRDSISFAAVVHDIGKVAVPDWILQKPGRLTFEEFQIVKNHTRKGKKMFENFLESIDKTSDKYQQLVCCADVCMSHHERYDGEGYPEGLKGEEIPIAAQIVGIADAYDVLVSEKIYKSAYGKDEAFDMILEGDCGAFSPKLLQIFRMSRMELEEIYE